MARKPSSAKKRSSNIPARVINVHTAMIEDHLKRLGLEGMPLTKAAKVHLDPRRIEREVRRHSDLKWLIDGDKRSGKPVSLRGINEEAREELMWHPRNEIIRRRMDELHAIAALAGMPRYTRNSQVPAGIKQLHQQYMGRCMQELGLQGRRLRSDAKPSFSPIALENAVLERQAGSRTRRAAGVEFPGVENETDPNQLRMDVIHERMRNFHASGRLVTKR